MPASASTPRTELFMHLRNLSKETLEEDYAMADENSFDYLYVVEWDDVVHRPPYTVMHRIKLKPGASRQAFERFMAGDGFSQVSEVQTRIGQVAAQYLYETTQSSGVPSRVEELDVDLSSFTDGAPISSFKVVASWRRT
jgi:hypothetical protein